MGKRRTGCIGNRRGMKALVCALLIGLGIGAVCPTAQAAPSAAERQRIRLTLLNLVPSDGLAVLRRVGQPTFFGPEVPQRVWPGSAQGVASLACRQGVSATFTDGKASTRLVILDLGDVLGALAGLQQITPKEAKDAEVGRKGFQAGTTWAACRGCYLFWALGPSAEALVRRVDQTLVGAAQQPTLLDLFPRYGLVKGSERAFPSGIPSMEFLGGAAAASYRFGSKSLDLYLVEHATREVSAAVFARLQEEAQRTQRTYRSVSLGKGEALTAEWKDLGRVVVAQAGRYLVVAAGNPDVGLLQQAVSNAIENLVSQVGPEGLK